MQKQDNKIDNKIEHLIESAIGNIKSAIDAEMVIGKQIKPNDFTTIIPVSKISVGFVVGGGEYSKDLAPDKNKPLSAGSGAGFSVNPIGFLVADNKTGVVNLLKVNKAEPLCTLIEALPQLVKSLNKKGK